MLERQSVRVGGSEIVMGLLGNCLILLIPLYASLLSRFYPAFYIFSVQEDEYQEWATFWCFAAAVVTAFAAASRQRKTSGRWPWFLVGVGLFCFLFAMEEISWGQRLLGYRPPTYFLEHNFQQEFNFHNVTSTHLRQLILKIVILGYGVVLAVAGRIPSLGRFLHRVAVVAPPIWLAPSFLVSFVIYDTYPWEYSGEIVELMLGLAFLLALLPAARPGRFRSRWRPLLLPVGLSMLMAALGLGSAALSRNRRESDPQVVQTAKMELHALKRDFELIGHRPSSRTRCGLHKRVYSYMVKYRRRKLKTGFFSSLRQRGLAEARADYFIDPWNTPYWIQHECSKETGQTAIRVYSFGPNRRRDSTDFEVLGDDLAAEIHY